MNTPAAPWLVVVLLLASAPLRGADSASFERTIKPFLQTNCVECHGKDKAKGDVVLDHLTGQVNAVSERGLWIDILDQLDLGAMPPEKAKQQPTPEQTAVVMAWIRSQVKTNRPKDAVVEIDKRELPGFGNYIKHDALFDPKAATRQTAASPARLWRLNPYAYRMRLVELLGTGTAETVRRDPIRNQSNDGLNPAFGLDTSRHEFSDFAVLYGFESNSTELLLASAYAVADMLAHSPTFKPPAWYALPGPPGGRVAKPGKRGGKDDKEPEAPVKEGPAPSAAQVGEYLAEVFVRIIDRPMSDSERGRYVGLYQGTLKDAPWRIAVQTALAAVMASPEAVFRIETGRGNADAHGRRMLAPDQLAQAIGFALLDGGPDRDLLAAASSGRLNSAAEVRQQVERLLADPDTLAFGNLDHQWNEPDVGPVMRFFREYFEYDKAKTVFKDERRREPPLYNNNMATAAVLELDNLIRWVLSNDKDVFRTLLTTERTYVDFDYARQQRLSGKGLPEGFVLARRSYLIYGLGDDWKWTDKQPVSFPKNQRMGVLTHPAWLIAFSDNEKNKAIQRGRWIQTKLLGGTVPDAPITVNAQLPEEDGKSTLRDRMHVTRENYCWTCHQKMDPYGLPFEQYDLYGYYRTKELGKPVDTTGKLSIGNSEVDGAVKSPFEMIARIAESRLAKQVFIRHAFRFFMGRNETLADAPTMIAAEKAYDESQGSFKALVTSLLTSDSFLYRRMPTDEKDAQ